MGGMCAETELYGQESKTVGASHDLLEATAKAKKMVVEYGFGEIMKNASLIQLQDYTLASGKDVLDDIQKILTNAREESEGFLAKNKEALLKLVDALMREVLMSGESLSEFFRTNPLE